MADQKVTFKQAKEKAAAAYGAQRLSISLALLSGLILLLIKLILAGVDWLPKEHFVSAMLEHCGIAFVVAAIAVFGFEWNAHINETNDLGLSIKRLLAEGASFLSHLKEARSLPNAVEAMAILHYVIELRTLHRDGALRIGLNELITGDAGTSAHELKLQIEQIVSNIRELQASGDSDSNSDSDSDYYVSFFSGAMRSTITENLRELVAAFRRNQRAAFLKIPSRAEILSEILAAQMSAMKEGDKYEVVSDLYSWKANRLARFQRATEVACSKAKVEVIRIFNLFTIPSERGANEKGTSVTNRKNRDIDPSDIEKILRSHLSDMNHWPDKKYRAYVFGLYERDTKEDQGQTFNAIDQEDLDKTHFGLFSHSGREQISFNVRNSRLSHIDISKDADEVGQYSNRFKELMRFASVLSEESIKRFVREYQEL